MSSDFSTLSDPRYDTRVDLSFIFAKISYTTDEAPYSTYCDSCAALNDIDKLLCSLIDLVKLDESLIGSLSQFLLPRVDKIITKVLIKSFLNCCILEMWNQSLEPNIFDSFSLIFKSLALAGSYLNCKDPYINNATKRLQISDSSKMEIVDRLLVLSAQHLATYPTTSQGSLSRVPDYGLVTKKASLDMFDTCIETVLVQDLSPSVELLRYLCNKCLAANSNRSDVKLHFVREYLGSWQHRLFILKGYIDPESIAQLEQLRNKLLLDEEGKLNAQLCLLIRSINKFILAVRYVNGEFNDILKEEYSKRELASSRAPELPEAEMPQLEREAEQPTTGKSAPTKKILKYLRKSKSRPKKT